MGIEGVNSRIADIQSRIIAMQTQAATQATRTTSATGATSASASTFAGVLKDAMATQTPSSSTKYELNSKGIPKDLIAYGNGKIPKNALGEVGTTGHRLWAPAAENLNNMIEAAKKDGVKIGITDSYRPYEEQVSLAKRKGLYSQGGLAAKPGTSEHGWGMAADLDLNGKALTWMRANAAKFGFDESVPRESWHWSFKPNG